MKYNTEFHGAVTQSKTIVEETLPYLTEAIPGIGGIIKAQPEDFQVEELPLYQPAGSGEHLYLRVTKRGLSTPDMVRMFASVLGVKAQRIGVAGLKDARAVTTQYVSVQGVDEQSLGRLTRDPRILAIDVLGRHRNRLRTGHHRGNRFRLVVREIHRDAAPRISRILEEMSRRGVPNYFGSQRQGRSGQNYRAGAGLLRDAAGRTRMGRSQRLWYLHAYQSFLFNKIVAARIHTLDRVMPGDWAMKHANGACFQVEDAEREQPRVVAFDISPTGILFGSRAPWASGEPGEIERAAVKSAGETPEGLQAAARACGFRGERRPLRFKAADLNWSVEDTTLVLKCTLPPGAYATNVLRELMKMDHQSGHVQC